MLCKHILLITFLNEPEFFFGTQLNGFVVGLEFTVVWLGLEFSLVFVSVYAFESI